MLYGKLSMDCIFYKEGDDSNAEARLRRKGTIVSYVKDALSDLRIADVRPLDDRHVWRDTLTASCIVSLSPLEQLAVAGFAPE